MLVQVSLKPYFESLLDRVENSEEIQNNGKDENGFYSPTRTLLIRHLNLLKDLYDKPMAKAMVKDSWAWVVAHVPPEWLILSDEQKMELKKWL